MQEKDRLDESPCVHETGHKHKRAFQQITKTLVCLMLCMVLVFTYSIKEPVNETHAAAAVVSVVADVAVVGCLTLLGISIGGAMNNESAGKFCNDIWNGLTQAAKDGVQAFKDIPITGSDGNSAIMANGQLNPNLDYGDMQSVKYWEAHQNGQAVYYTYTKQAVTEIYNGFTAQRAKLAAAKSATINLPAGTDHPLQFAGAADFANFLGCGYADNNSNGNWLNSTDFKILQAVQPKDLAVDLTASKSMTAGIYSFNFGAPFKNDSISTDCSYSIGVTVYKNGALLCSPNLNSNYFIFMGAYTKFYLVTYVVANVHYLNMLVYQDYNNSTHYSAFNSAFVGSQSTDGIIVSKDDVINKANDQFYASELSALNTKFDELMDKLFPDGKAKVTGKVNANDLPGARTGTQTDVKGQTMADSQAAERDKATNADTDTTPPKPLDMPDLSLPEVIFKDKFPFCLPWDFYNAFASLATTSSPPKYVIPVKMPHYGIDETITIDFSQFDLLAKILRWGLSVIFVIGLILVTRKLIGAE